MHDLFLDLRMGFQCKMGDMIGIRKFFMNGNPFSDEIGFCGGNYAKISYIFVLCYLCSC
jgi:hypothetical protein